MEQPETRFQTITDTVSDSIIIVDQQGVVQFVNPAAETLFERSGGELVGTPFGFPVVAGDTIDLDIVRKSGDPCVAEMRVVEMKLGDEIVHLATLRDVTERKFKERELRQLNSALEQRVDERTAQRDRLNERLNVIFNTTSDAIALVDSGGRIDLTNPAFTRHFGYLPEELLNKPLSRVTASPYDKDLDWSIQQVVSTGVSDRIQGRARRKDGTTFDVEISLSRVVNNDDHLVCNIHDISHFKAVERMKDNFVSMVNHELRTPISSILLSLELVQNYFERMPYEKTRQRLVQCFQQAVTLKELVEGILEHSELQARGRTRDTSYVDVLDTLTRVVEELKPSALAKRQTMAVISGQEFTSITGNPLDFTRIWRNLISNSIKYTPDEGKIFIRLTHLRQNDLSTLSESSLVDKARLEELIDFRNADYVVGQVEDTGHGIRPEDLDNLFERFNRGWAKGSGISGTGLGLSLVQDLLSVYEGDICVSSKVGKGSIFTFWIPILNEA